MVAEHGRIYAMVVGGRISVIFDEFFLKSWTDDLIVIDITDVRPWPQVNWFYLPDGTFSQAPQEMQL